MSANSFPVSIKLKTDVSQCGKGLKMKTGDLDKIIGGENERRSYEGAG
jgi:hypothetical protein